MAFPVSIGTFCIYGASALFSFIGQFKYTFYLATIMLVAIGVIWFFSADKLIYKCQVEKNEVDGEEVQITENKCNCINNEVRYKYCYWY
jgi:hypothetical protein